jgi:hypothetical protein
MEAKRAQVASEAEVETEVADAENEVEVSSE